MQLLPGWTEAVKSQLFFLPLKQWNAPLRQKATPSPPTPPLARWSIWPLWPPNAQEIQQSVSCKPKSKDATSWRAAVWFLVVKLNDNCGFTAKWKSAQMTILRITILYYSACRLLHLCGKPHTLFGERQNHPPQSHSYFLSYCTLSQAFPPVVSQHWEPVPLQLGPQRLHCGHRKKKRGRKRNDLSTLIERKTIEAMRGWSQNMNECVAPLFWTCVQP